MESRIAMHVHHTVHGDICNNRVIERSRDEAELDEWMSSDVVIAWRTP